MTSITDAVAILRTRAQISAANQARLLTEFRLPTSYRPTTLARSASTSSLARGASAASFAPVLRQVLLQQGMAANRSEQSQTGPVPSAFGDLIAEATRRYNLPSGLLPSVIKAESGFNPRAVSPAGAKGLMQLMDGTARTLGVRDSFDPAQNIDGGARFLRQLLDRYGGDVRRALAAYNAGPGAVDRYGGIPPYPETQTYVSRILGYMTRT